MPINPFEFSGNRSELTGEYEGMEGEASGSQPQPLPNGQDEDLHLNPALKARVDRYIEA